MDDVRFDRLARLAARSRRSLFGAAAAAVAALVPGRGAMAACRAPGKPCDPNRPQACCSKKCSARKRCLCTKASQCPRPTNPCTEAACRGGACKPPVDKRDGSACPGGRCENGRCRCGDGPACAGDQTCLRGACCDAVVADVAELLEAHCAAKRRGGIPFTMCLGPGTYDLPVAQVCGGSGDVDLGFREKWIGAGKVQTIVRGSGGDQLGRAAIRSNGGDNVLADLTITGGDGLSGGGINNQGTLTLIDCAVTGNRATTGAGIFSRPADEAGELTLIRCDVTGNVAGREGGGIANDGRLTIVDCNISGNTAPSSPNCAISPESIVTGVCPP